MKYNAMNLALLTLILMLASCGEKLEEAPKKLRPLKYQTVRNSNAGVARTFSGTAEMDKTIELSFRSSGILSEFDLVLGQRVKKGQLLARLDNVQARLSYEQALTNLNSAASNLKTTRLGLDRARNLFEKGSTALSQYESAKNAYQTALESYESAKRGVGIQKEQIEFGYLYAPWDGVIAEVNVEVNENVNPGQAVAVLNAGNTMEISLGLPESVINQVAIGDTLEVRFTSLLGNRRKAIVSELSPSVSRVTSTYPLRARLLGESDNVKSGMSADVTFHLDRNPARQDLLFVPPQAVGEDENGRYVFVVKTESGKTIVRKQQVTLGDLGNAGFDIRSGLNLGDTIATAGLQTLLDRQEVKLFQ